MNYHGQDIVSLIETKNCKTKGDLNLVFSEMGPLGQASTKTLSFCNKRGEEACRLLNDTQARIILCHEEALSYDVKAADKLLIGVKNPRLYFIRCLKKFFPKEEKQGVHPTAVIGKDCSIGKNVTIGAHTCIGDHVSVGDFSKIYNSVVVNDNVQIGKNVILKSGCVIGHDGFGYERNEEGELEKFPHSGTVVIKDDVEVGSNTTIDRGVLGNTVIGENTKIDNLVHIAHNVSIGKNCEIIAHAMIGGSARIGDFAHVSPGAQVMNQITIGERAVVGLGAVVTKNVQAGAVVAGSPARPMDEFRSYLNYIKKEVLKNEK